MTDASVPSSVLRTDLPWADVVVDLRFDQTSPLHRRRVVRGRRSREVEHGRIAVSDRAVTGDCSRTLIWTDTTGFTGAIVVDQPQQTPDIPRLNAIFPHLATLLDKPGVPSSPGPDERARTRRGEEAFGTALAAIRTILTTPSHRVDAQPVDAQPAEDHLSSAPNSSAPNSSAPNSSAPAARERAALLLTPPPGIADTARPARVAAFRLAWAGVGISDLDQVPLFLRDEPSSPNPDSALTRPDATRFAALTVGGSTIVTRFQRCGWTNDLDTIAAWAEATYGDNWAAARASAVEIEELSAWVRAGFDTTTPADATWANAARYNALIGSPQFIPPAAVAALRAARLTPAHVHYLSLALDPDLEPVHTLPILRRWLALSPDLERTCAYLAAGITIEEAERLDLANAAPEHNQLRTLIALRTDDIDPTMRALPPLPGPGHHTHPPGATLPAKPAGVRRRR